MKYPRKNCSRITDTNSQSFKNKILGFTQSQKLGRVKFRIEKMRDYILYSENGQILGF
jgi:hypothetical protein